jgi:hypothetical protein
MQKPSDLTKLDEIAVSLGSDIIEIATEDMDYSSVAVLDIDDAKLVRDTLTEMIDYLEYRNGED